MMLLVVVPVSQVLLVINATGVKKTTLTLGRRDAGELFLLIPTGESRGLLFSQIIVICKQFHNKKNLYEC